MRGNVPSMLNLWFAAGVGTLAGSENIIRSMVHVVETFALEEGKCKNHIRAKLLIEKQLRYTSGKYL